jgi:tungstate transport system permease protein
MNFIWESFLQALRLIVGLDPYLISVIRVSVYVSGVALLLSSVFSAVVASFLSFKRFRGRSVLQLLVYTGMGVPSVIVGLFVLLMLAKELIWTPMAMIIAQFVLITPLITGVMMSSFNSVQQRIADAALTLGANRWQRGWTFCKEARFGLMTAVIVGFGRAISEVGAVLMVGGNIVWADGLSYTRTLTTAIVVETRKGRFEEAMALGIILITVVLIVNLITHKIQKMG